MKENWNNIKKTAEGFGSELDTHAAWERFEKKKKKKRGLFFIPIIGAAIIVSFFLLYSDMYIPTAAKDGLVLEITRNETINQTKELNVDTKENLNVSQKSTKDKISVQSETKKTTTPLEEFTTNKSRTKSTTKETAQINTIADHQTSFETTSQAIARTKIIKQDIDKAVEKYKDPEINIAREKINILPFISSYDLVGLTTSRKKVECHLLSSPISKSVNKNGTSPMAIKEWNMLIGYGIAQRNLTSNNTAFAQRRIESEDFINHLSLQLKVTTELTHNFSLEYGLGANRYQSRIVEITQELDPGFLFSDVVIEEKTQDGITSQVFGDIVGSQTVITQRTRYQQYFDLDAIVQLGFTLFSTNKFKAKIASGIAYRFMGLNHGSSHASEFSFAEYATLSDLGYKVGNLWKASSDFQLSYAFDEQRRILFGLNHQMDLNNRIKSGFDLKDQFSSLNFMIGLNSKF